MSIKISALLITYNEEDNILRFLDEASYAEEIIIVDSFSTDKTEELAIKNPKVHFVKRKFDNFTAQRNFALSLAKNDWVTFFDADEELSEDLIKEIVSTVNSKNVKAAYYVCHDFYFNEKKIKYSGQQNVKAVRVFKKSKCKYVDNLKVHELLICDSEIGKIKHKIKHHTFVDENFYLEKLNVYSKLRAQELRIKNLKPTFYHYKIKPLYRFFNYYILRLGFLDGIQGYKISKLHAISIANRYKFLDEIYKEEQKLF
ncbi:glycosyltransferase family 2 protein [Chishuiella sp.]|uniref:glycosyltransferase family 2 protein n=1 Tax=Chishuiella sp. TaxID=1969467 RepID=UPI0028B15F74|nr:glycosyltransferase family 2 protein [Chishuiella sp.]